MTCRLIAVLCADQHMRAQVKGNPVAMHEFDLEHGMLCRISHPHIIKVLGAGRVPRRFIVLEYLGGGSLHNILAENQSKPGLAQRLFHKATFSYLDLLAKARDMADALQYLHEHCHTGATIIHRDLKPDNVGFTSDGRVKLFDFGLSTCVRARARDSDAYEMTGYTGSLRYMAPEVALRQPYTEKVDVYSFSIMVWQMARDRVPFKGFNKDIFMKQVVRYNDRPKLDSSWPAGFSDLLVECWSRDPAKRPTFTVVKARLDKLIADESHSGKRAKKGKIIKAVENNVKNPAPTQSSWF